MAKRNPIDGSILLEGAAIGALGWTGGQMILNQARNQAWGSPPGTPGVNPITQTAPATWASGALGGAGVGLGVAGLAAAASGGGTETLLVGLVGAAAGIFGAMSIASNPQTVGLAGLGARSRRPIPPVMRQHSPTASVGRRAPSVREMTRALPPGLRESHGYGCVNCPDNQPASVAGPYQGAHPPLPLHPYHPHLSPRTMGEAENVRRLLPPEPWTPMAMMWDNDDYNFPQQAQAAAQMVPTSAAPTPGPPAQNQTVVPVAPVQPAPGVPAGSADTALPQAPAPTTPVGAAPWASHRIAQQHPAPSVPIGAVHPVQRIPFQMQPVQHTPFPNNRIAAQHPAPSVPIGAPGYPAGSWEAYHRR